MKLLLDQNLSPRLVAALGDLFPDSKHVREVGMHHASDLEVWGYARANGYALVSKDADFRQYSFLFGFPPKVIWLRIGNCSVDDTLRLLVGRAPDIERFANDEEAALLVLS